MIEGALEADGRIAAKNAVKIRAALRELADYKQLFLQYQETQPVSTDNLAKDRSRARAWAIMNVTQMRTEALESALWRMWAEAYVLGDVAASEWLRKTRELNKADDDGYVDWANWKPGDRAAALMLRRPKAFQQILDQTGVSIRGMTKTSVTDIGNALADAVELGLDAERAALLISRHVASPARALTIAITEQNRVMSAATIQRYKEAELEKMEWHVSDPCAKCAQNSGVEVPIGTSFPSGNTQPPAHPHCRCVLLPVIPGMDETPEMPGATTVVPPSPVDFGPDAATVPTPRSEEFSPGAWTALSRPEIRTAIIDRYLAGNPKRTREEIADYVDRGRIDKADLSLLRSGTIVKNGPIEVQFYSTGAKLPEATKQNVLKIIDKLQETNPKKKAVLAIGSESSSKRGWALLGGERLWITPKTARFTDTNAPDVGFKMPVLGKVSQVEYTLAHEWGHLIDEGGGFGKGGISFQAPNTIAKINEFKKEFPDAFKSSYSAENTKEFYAEMFTEYFNSNGLTDNPLVQAMAKEFKWKAPEVAKPAPVKAVAFPKNAPSAKTVEAWNKEEIIEIAKIKDNPAQPTQIWNGPEKQYITAYRQVGDPRLKAILQAQGFTKTPTVVDATQFDVLAKQGGIKIYRGVTETSDLTAAQMIEQFKTGDMFVGTGVVGNGVYSGTDLAYVIKYAGDKSENVMEMMLSPKAKFIDAKEAEEGAKQLAGAFYDAAFGRKYSNPELGKIVDGYIEKLGGVPGSREVSTMYQNQLRELGWLYHDPGAYAATNGYDAIRSIDEDGAIYVILNRGAVVVKK